MTLITIRYASDQDISAIQLVAREAWTHTYRDIYSEAFIEHFLSRAYSAENLMQSVEQDEQNDPRSFWVAELDERIAGYAQVAPVSDVEHELLRIYVRPEYHRLGIGKSFLQEYKNSFPVKAKLFAWVAKENRTGRDFYERNNFEQVAEKVEQIQGMEKVQIKYEREF